MKRLLIVLSLVLAVSGGAFAQTSDAAKRSTEIMEKMRQIDLLNHLIPLAMTKEQIRKLLPEIEKARRDVRTQEAEEAKLLAERGAKVDKAVKDGVEKGDVPDKELLRELSALLRFFSMKRKEIGDDNTTKVIAVVKTTFNAGQLKVAGNTLNFGFYNPDVKPEEITDDARLTLFVREILLDPLAYDILVRMQAGQRG